MAIELHFPETPTKCICGAEFEDNAGLMKHWDEWLEENKKQLELDFNLKEKEKP